MNASRVLPFVLSGFLLPSLLPAQTLEDYEQIKIDAFAALRAAKSDRREGIRMALRDLAVAATLFRVRGDEDENARAAFEQAVVQVRAMLAYVPL